MIQAGLNLGLQKDLPHFVGGTSIGLPVAEVVAALDSSPNDVPYINLLPLGQGSERDGLASCDGGYHHLEWAVNIDS